MSMKQEGLVMKYFVLKPAGTDAYAMASRRAMRAYAATIEATNPQLSFALHDWVDAEMRLAEDKLRKGDA